MERPLMNTPLILSAHAIHRQARRNLSQADIEFVLDYGQQRHCAGALHIFLGRRDIPADKETQRRFGQLEGTVLVIAETAHGMLLITAYRNREALKRIRSKVRYGYRVNRYNRMAA